MAYAAVLSLKLTIKPLLNPSHVWIVQSTARQIIQPLYEDVCSLQEVLKELDSNSSSSSSSNNNLNRKRVNALDGKIRDAVSEFEDAVESHFSNRVQKSPAREEEINHHPLMDLKELQQDIDSFTRKMNTMKATYIHELRHPSPHDNDDGDVIGSRIDFGGNDEPGMVGLSNLFMQIKEDITKVSEYYGVSLLSLYGMAGIGKTTLAKKLYQDRLISSHFERCAFVFLGPKYQLERVLLDILKQVNRDFDGDKMLIMKEGEEKIDSLKRIVSESLLGRRYLIVLDDVWDVNVKDRLESSLFPWTGTHGSQVVMTTRLYQVARTSDYNGKCRVPFLNKKESWDLLRLKVFGEESTSFSYELEKAGKKIAENCEGLPLTIVTVGKLLSQSNQTIEYWNEVAANKKHSVYVDAYEQMYKVLYPSYDYLPQHLKPCFLYMGVFPQNYEIPCSKLFDLWVAEGFHEPDVDKTQACSVRYFFLLLSFSNVVLNHKTSLDNETKTCGLISPFWHLCNKVAANNKFFHGLNSLSDGLAEETMKSQRRLCIRNNVLFAIKDVFDSMASISTVRSLLCTGPYHPYPVPICLSSRLLMILDAITIHFYDFPIEVVNLVQLTYLTLTFEGNVPHCISQLWNLHYLIVHRKLSIVESNGNFSSYLPVGIWDLKELEHLRIEGRNLPHPNCEGGILPKLLTLLDVGPQSCTKDVLERLPNLQKLGIRIELAPDNNTNNNDEPLCFFDHISHLHKLEKLKCVVVNPKMIVHAPLSVFPSSLVKLTLSGLGYPWEEMSKISSLPNLEVLKLQCFAFRGPKWHVQCKEFLSLKFLLIEDSDLVKWTFSEYFCLALLERLSMKHCYKLEEVPTFTTWCNEIELADCNHVAVACAKKRKDVRDRTINRGLVLNIHYSWD